MKTTFIALLHQLEIDEDLGPGDKINDDLRITNNRETISALIHSAFRPIMGEMEVASLLSGQPVIFAEAEIPEGLSPHEYLLARLYEVQSFLMTTWAFQDNAINCELGFLLFTSNGMATAASNFVAHLYTNCTSEKTVTKLTRDRLREMRTLHRKEIRIPDRPFALPISQLTSAHPRLSRAFYILNAARGERDIAMKIAHYCTAFETLFATSQTELAHQLSERIACFLHSDVEQRLDTYRRVKTAYGLRSKVVHGSTLKESKIDDAIATIEFCDGIARKIFHQFFTSTESREPFELGAEQFDEMMLRKIFSTQA